jgi:hypothetical protein
MTVEHHQALRRCTRRWFSQRENRHLVELSAPQMIAACRRPF